MFTMTTFTRANPAPSVSLSAAQRRFLLIEQGAGAGVVNFVLNGLVAWACYRTLSSVPFFGSQGVVGDTVATSVILPVITCLISVPTIRRRLANGSLEPIWWTPSGRYYAMIYRSLENTLARGLVLGVASVVCAAIPVLVVMWAVPVPALSLREFLLFKATYAAVLGAVVTPIAAALVLATPAGTPLRASSPPENVLYEPGSL